MILPPQLDRRAIAKLLGPHFPVMEGASSEEWHGFLNAQTGLDIGPDVPNPVAFDAWRQALAEKGLPVWRHTPDDVARMRARGDELVRLEKERQTATAARAKQIVDDLLKQRAERAKAEAKKARP